MKTYGFGIIGCGMISDFHSAAIADIKNGKLVAVSSRKSENSQRLVDRYNIQAYSDYNEMLSREDIDIVCICTPSGAHMEPAVAAAEAGKHVIIEKPTFMRPDQLIKAYNTAEKHGLHIFPVFQNRYNKAVQRVKNAIVNKQLGDIRIMNVRLRWCRPQRYYDMAPWRGTFSHDGGALTNQGIHHIDLLRYLGGDIEKVNCTMRTLGADIEVEDCVVSTFTYNNGVTRNFWS